MDQNRSAKGIANSSPIFKPQPRREQCRIYIIPTSKPSPRTMRTCEPTRIGRNAWISAPDELTSSARPRTTRSSHYRLDTTAEANREPGCDPRARDLLRSAFDQLGSPTSNSYSSPRGTPSTSFAKTNRLTRERSFCACCAQQCHCVAWQAGLSTRKHRVPVRYASKFFWFSQVDKAVS